MEKTEPGPERLGQPGNVYQSRAWAGAQDLQLMLALIRSARPPAWRADYPGRDDLFEMMQSLATRANTRLWFWRGALAGFAILDEFNNLLFDSDPGAFTVLGDEFVRWGEECAARSGRRTLDAVCRASDLARLAFLERHGFRRSVEETVLMQRDLHASIPEVELPEGFTIRAAAGEGEAAALAELHRAAFGTEHMTTENRLALMRAPGYEPGLDLVAVAPGGSLAAYCICSIDEMEGEQSDPRQGRTDPVATHPGYRRLGLARALLSTGLSLLRERGMGYASLGTSRGNVAMQRAAEAVGFIVKDTKIWLEKDIGPGREEP